MVERRVYPGGRLEEGGELDRPGWLLVLTGNSATEELRVQQTAQTVKKSSDMPVISSSISRSALNGQI